MPIDLDKLEIERAVNLIVNFGWSKTKEQLTDDKIILTIEHPRVSVPPVTGEGAD